MIDMSEKNRKERLRSVRDADADHDAMMESIVSIGGKTLKQVRSMSMKKKDAFISKCVNLINDA